MATRTPGWEDIPGGYPDCTPRSERARYVDAPSSRSDHDSGTQQSPLNFTQPQSSTPGGGRAFVSGISTHNHETPNTDISPTDSPTLVHSGENTALTSPSPAASATSSLAELTPIRTAQPQNTITRTASGRELTEDELFRTLSQRSRRGSSFYQRSSHRRDSGHEDDTEDEDDDGHDEQIERLLSQIFGQSRQDASVEEQTRHRGIVFRNLTVKGIGHGAALKATNSDILLGPLRKLWGLVTLERMRRGKPVRTIIDDFTGVVRPKEMCLVLARPGGGASTFLKVIGNQRSGFEAVEGDVVYGGTGAKEMAKKYRNEVLYNPEDDLHYATLTVEETLRFALKTRTPGKESRKEGESRGDYVREFLRSVAKLFWIEHTMGTKVGNDIIRGVSGGEKKRVSIAEAMVTKASVQCWDNSTKGLDASTATEYVSSLRALTNMAKISTFVALYQAGEGLYDLFDKVLLIHEGKCAYFGPSELAKEYFESLGFECLPRWTTADFLTSTTDEHARHVKKGWENRIPRTPEEFEQAYRKSDIAKATIEDIDDFEATLEQQKESRALETTKKTKTKNYQIPFHRQVYECTIRQFQVMKGDPASSFGKWGGILFQSLIVGSLFYSLPSNAVGVFPRGGIMFFTLLFNSLLALSELTGAFGSRPILLKHKSFSFYRPSAYAFGLVLADLPQVAVQTVLWSLIIYFMTGLQRTASQFFIFLIVTYFLTLALYSFFRALAAFSASLDVASRLTGIAVQALVVYTGYLIPPGSMHPWFSWIRWINPVQYSFEALMANEFTGMEIECIPPYLVPPTGDPEYQSCLIQGSRPGQTAVPGEDYISTAYYYTRSHLWRNLGIVIGFWIFFSVLNAIGLEMLKPNKGGASVTVFKRGQVSKDVKKNIEKGGVEQGDEEKGHTGAVDQGGQAAEEKGEAEAAAEGVAKNETVFTWQDVRYVIPTKSGEKVLLDNVSGYVRPGKLTALMGESGAGKTTLLNALAQRLGSFGTVTGEFLVDGSPLPISFQRSTGFAEQQDVHEPNQTVREALQFSALLRQPAETPVKEKYEYVEKILSLLEMQNIAGAMVGEIGNGLNQEQRKRLTIGVELAARPSLLFFLDEPTSGLDSQAAWNVVRFLRKLADAGQAILCTIHQPSAILFEEFDELLLLKAGGKVVYHGELGKDSQTMIGYFERNGGVKCPKSKNPAEYMLEAIGAGDPTKGKLKDWGDVWRNSPEHQSRLKEIQDFISSRHSKASTSTADNREFATSWALQTMTVVKRSYISFWRAPEYIIGLFALHILTALFNSFTFYRLGTSSIDMQSRLFSIFMTITIAPPLIQQLQPRFLAARDLFTARERASKIYPWTSFVAAHILAEIPYRLVAGTFYFAAWYWPVGFPRASGTAAFTWGLLMAFQLYYLGFGLAIASIAPNELLASMLVPIFFIFVVSFCGVVVPYYAMPTFWKKWMFHLSPFRYLTSSLLSTLVHDIPVDCKSSEAAKVRLPPGSGGCSGYLDPVIQQLGMGSVKQAVLGEVGGEEGCEVCQFSTGDEFAMSFAYEYKTRWRDFGIFWAFVAFNFVMVFVGTWIYLGGFKRVFKRKGKKGGKKGGKKEKSGQQDNEKMQEINGDAGPQAVRGEEAV